MESSPLNLLPQDTLHLIFSHLPLRQIIVSKSVCKSLYTTLSSTSFLHLLAALHHLHHPPLSLLALRPSHRHCHVSPHPTLNVYDPVSNRWLRFPLSFLPFPSLHPISSSLGLLYLWADPTPIPNPIPKPTRNPNNVNNKFLIACNPLTRQFKVLPQLGSAWSRHGSVIVGGGGGGSGGGGDGSHQVLVITELAVLYYSNTNASNNWLKFSSNLPSKPRSPTLISKGVYALCDVGSPWRSQWKLYKCNINNLQATQQWAALEKPEWGDIFDILKRPRLVEGTKNKLLMIGGLKSSYALHSVCTTILILRLDLESLEWDEAGRMPGEMYRLFQDSSKFKVFGGGNRLCFTAKRVGRLALWDCEVDINGSWRWIDDIPGNSDGLFRGFTFEARLSAVP